MKRIIAVETLYNGTVAMTIFKVAAGWYQVSDGRYYSNIRRGEAHRGELVTKWYTEIRRGREAGGMGEIVRWAGIWDTAAEAITEASYLIGRR